MTVYEPGTVAVATVRGVPNVRVMLAHDGTWVSAERVNRCFWHSLEDDITDVRPLVVLDLDAIGWSDSALLVKTLRLAGSHNLADAIEAQSKPPRIPEPGLWGVVEASWDSKQPTSIPRAEWMRTKGNEWRSCISAVVVRWDDLIDPTLIRDGIEDGAS